MPLMFLWILVTWIGQQSAAPAAASSALDFDAFKTRVEPIFLAKRPGLRVLDA